MGKKKNKQKQTEQDLLELSTLDEVSVHMVSSMDIDAGSVPPWCEAILTLKRDSSYNALHQRIPIKRHDGELIIESLHGALHPRAGGAAVDGLWADLDAVMDRLMVEPEDEDRGLAVGLTIALARLSNPFQPDEDHVKGVAVERWEARQV